ncbi:MAG TPA: hypothetical protein VFU94_14920 [Conexibacter sp.]|nr:hypothetical protein [Conexibacter sp.]
MPICPHIPRDSLRRFPCQRCETCGGWVDGNARVLTDAQALAAFPQLAPAIRLYPVQQPALPQPSAAERVFALIAAVGRVATLLLVAMIALPIAAAVLYVLWTFTH